MLWIPNPKQRRINGIQRSSEGTKYFETMGFNPWKLHYIGGKVSNERKVSVKAKEMPPALLTQGLIEMRKSNIEKKQLNLLND